MLVTSGTARDTDCAVHDGIRHHPHLAFEAFHLKRHYGLGRFLHLVNCVIHSGDQVLDITTIEGATPISTSRVMASASSSCRIAIGQWSGTTSPPSNTRRNASDALAMAAACHSKSGKNPLLARQLGHRKPIEHELDRRLSVGQPNPPARCLPLSLLASPPKIAGEPVGTIGKSDPCRECAQAR